MDTSGADDLLLPGSVIVSFDESVHFSVIALSNACRTT